MVSPRPIGLPDRTRSNRLFVPAYVYDANELGSKKKFNVLQERAPPCAPP